MLRFFLLLFTSGFNCPAGASVLRNDADADVGPTDIRCYGTCVCGNINDLILRAERNASTGVDSTVMQSRTILHMYIQTYDLSSSAYGIVCPGQNFTTLPRFSGKNSAMRHPDFVNSTSLLIFRCGILRGIRANDLRHFRRTLEVADLSHNRISFVSTKALRSLRNLKVLDLSYNLLKTIGYFKEVSPRVVPFTKSDAPRRTDLLIEGNLLNCSCEVIETVTRHYSHPKNDNAYCQLNVTSRQRKRRNLQTGESTADKPQAIPFSFLSYVSIDLLKSCFDPEFSLPDYIDDKRRVLPFFRTPHGWDRHASVHRESYFQDMPRYPGDDMYRNRTNYPLRKEFTVDYPLLITMLAWFFMIFFGLSKFIRSNTIEYEMHKDYLRKLGEQANPAVEPITVVRGKKKKKKSCFC